MLLKRYGNIDSIIKLPFEDGLNIILTAMKGDLRDKCFQMFVIERIFLDEPMSFEEYFKNTLNTSEKISKEEINKKVDSILKKTLKRGGEVNGNV